MFEYLICFLKVELIDFFFFLIVLFLVVVDYFYLNCIKIFIWYGFIRGVRILYICNFYLKIIWLYDDLLNFL